MRLMSSHNLIIAGHTASQSDKTQNTERQTHIVCSFSATCTICHT